MSVVEQLLARHAGPSAAGPCTWPLTIATYNIHGAVGSDGRFSPLRVAGVLQEINADIVALQEVPLGGGHMANVVEVLQSVTGLHAAASRTCTIAGRGYGNAILSRFPIESTRALDLSFGSREPRGALDADIRCHDHAMRIIATHLGLSPAERRDQVKRLLQVFDTEEMPVILMGDLNEWFMWGKSLRWLVSHFQAVPAPRTFPARWPMFALDRIWIRPRHRLQSVRAHTSALARLASDHLPLVARIQE